MKSLGMKSLGMKSPAKTSKDPVSFAHIAAAARRLEGHGVRTPLVESDLLNQAVGGRLLVKAEMLQHTGSFKFRGAFNRLAQLDDGQRSGGVVAYSSGNHAQAVAYAAALLAMPAVIVMPADAPTIKIENTRAHGAEIVFYDRETDIREEIGQRLAAERGATLVPPYDDARIIAGQGTVGLEIAEQAGAIDARLDAVLVPCGGGGLSAGISIAMNETCPDAAVIAVEPVGFDDTGRSLAAGKRLAIKAGGHSFCDALLAPIPGEITFAINAHRLKGAVSVDDGQVAEAMAAAARTLKLVIEPGGAVALAAALSGIFDCRDKTVAVVCSGGNVDPETFARALSTAMATAKD